jgi:AcrR family transcriptional regulator
MTQEAEEGARYKRIVRASEELFKKNGFRGVTMEAVARDACVAKATLYSYFKNKDELFVVVCSRMADILLRAFTDAIAAAHKPMDDRVIEGIIAKHRITFTLIRSSPHAQDLFLHKDQLAGDIFAKTDDAILGVLAKTLRQEPELAASAPQLARALFFGTAEIAARSPSLAALEDDLRAFIATHLAGARLLARRQDRRSRGCRRG